MSRPIRAALAAATFAALSGTALSAEITLQTLDESIKPVIEAFEKANPGDRVKLQIVSYQTVLETLPVQLASGQAPDISVVTDLGGLAKYYLDITPYVDAAYFEAQYGPTLKWIRGTAGGRAINGVPDSMTVNGAFVNVSPSSTARRSGGGMPQSPISRRSRRGRCPRATPRRRMMSPITRR